MHRGKGHSRGSQSKVSFERCRSPNGLIPEAADLPKSERHTRNVTGVYSPLSVPSGLKISNRCDSVKCISSQCSATIRPTNKHQQRGREREMQSEGWRQTQTNGNRRMEQRGQERKGRGRNREAASLSERGRGRFKVGGMMPIDIIFPTSSFLSLSVSLSLFFVFLFYRFLV